MLAPAFQRKMNLLALVAMLLLLALPTAGRVLAGSSADSDGAWAQICTMAGLKLVKIAPGGANPLDSGPQPKAPGGAMADGDCAYCPVLGGMALALLVVLFAVPSSPRGAPPPWRLFAPRAFLHPSGLGSRGPPIAL
ncbi:MAG TPA: DUF2946 family protein [Lysobacter sp.]